MDKKDDTALQAKSDAMKRSAEQSKHKHINVTLASGGRSSLDEVINTQEKADLFMKLLKSL